MSRQARKKNKKNFTHKKVIKYLTENLKYQSTLKLKYLKESFRLSKENEELKELLVDANNMLKSDRNFIKKMEKKLKIIKVENYKLKNKGILKKILGVFL